MLIGGRDDLRAVAAVHFVTVVGAGVVRGGDHDAGDGIDMLDGEWLQVNQE